MGVAQWVLLGALVLVGLAGVGAVIRFVGARGYADGWRRLARQRGLTAHIPTTLWSGGWTITGAVDGTPVRVEVIDPPGHHEHRTAFLRVMVGLPERFRGVSLSAESLGDKLLDVIGAGDHKLGDPELDRALKVEGDPAAALDLVNAPGARAIVLQLATEGPGFKVRNGGAALDDRSMFATDPALVAARIDRLLALARAARRAP